MPRKQGGGGRRAALGKIPRTLPAGAVHGREIRRGFGRLLRCRGYFRFPQPHRHLRPGHAGGAGLRNAGSRLPGAGARRMCCAIHAPPRWTAISPRRWRARSPWTAATAGATPSNSTGSAAPAASSATSLLNPHTQAHRRRIFSCAASSAFSGTRLQRHPAGLPRTASLSPSGAFPDPGNANEHIPVGSVGASLPPQVPGSGNPPEGFSLCDPPGCAS